MNKVYNFNAGPAMLPPETLEQARRELIDYQGSGISIMESSHRSRQYDEVHQEAIANVRQLMKLPDEYAVLFMQGGASAQFALAPLNLAGPESTVDYIQSGYWAGKAIKEAQIQTKVNIAADTSAETPARLPRQEELNLTPGAAYVHLTSNETISGVQWPAFPQCEAPLVADMSSDILSRPFDVKPFGLIYAGAQKNLGPAGVTLVVLRRDLAERAGESVPIYFRYATHLKGNSLYNTPPTFGIYLLMLTTRWLLKQGGVDAIAERNALKAGRLYEVIDRSDFYRPLAATEHRSHMNVTFRLPSPQLEAEFLKQAGEEGFIGLKGHRSLGGIRASIYNAFPPEGVEALASFMEAFETAV